MRALVVTFSGVGTLRECSNGSTIRDWTIYRTPGIYKGSFRYSVFHLDQNRCGLSGQCDPTDVDIDQYRGSQLHVNFPPSMISVYRDEQEGTRIVAHAIPVGKHYRSIVSGAGFVVFPTGGSYRVESVRVR